MGICDSKRTEKKSNNNPDDLKSRELDEQLVEDNTLRNKYIKLLLLGAGESGKSTLFKALIHIYVGYSEEDFQNLIPTIQGNIISSMNVLLEESAAYGPLETAEAKEAKTFFDSNYSNNDFTKEMAACITKLWADEGIKKTYASRSNFQLVDSAKYFFEKVNQISDSNYLPNKDDMLQLRIQTTGIRENSFNIGGTDFKMVDVGGQRNERRKWIHCFEGVTAIIFVAAISEYDQVLFEDEDKNRMEEALELFDEMCNSKYFTTTSMILFLNKRDLFQEKIDKVPLTKCNAFADYTGTGYEEGCAYIKQAFLAKNANASKKQVYVNFTCATDTSHIATVFNAVKDIIINKCLLDAGIC